MDTATANQLRQFVEAIESLNEEKRETARHIAEKFKEAKGVGFDVPALRQCIRLRAMTISEREEKATILEVYMDALAHPEEVRAAMDFEADGYRA